MSKKQIAKEPQPQPLQTIQQLVKKPYIKQDDNVPETFLNQYHQLQLGSKSAKFELGQHQITYLEKEYRKSMIKQLQIQRAKKNAERLALLQSREIKLKTNETIQQKLFQKLQESYVENKQFSAQMAQVCSNKLFAEMDLPFIEITEESVTICKQLLQ
ncbi:Hypothetical_protein [Hexamita inflata]|uniref:Hypothetical_protein n=1 Tax=Hexamita inflata TaxID=28002 RepID=A0AA86P7M7_9EUKA|nr:Hypothetical protein HINF_LOCUS6480 [Hexamita inflata]CAI9932301.1 Hypothetical protein HINF_LOCUS19946 [Hexamita inflata]